MIKAGDNNESSSMIYKLTKGYLKIMEEIQRTSNGPEFAKHRGSRETVGTYGKDEQADYKKIQSAYYAVAQLYDYDNEKLGASLLKATIDRVSEQSDFGMKFAQK